MNEDVYGERVSSLLFTQFQNTWIEMNYIWIM